MIRPALPLIVALCVTSTAAAEANTTVAPVMIGNDQGLDIDACGAVGMIQDSDHSGSDGTVAVRSTPNGGAEVDRLSEGEAVYICDSADKGAWVGIIYPNANDADCNVSGTASDGPEPYSGPCRSGWVPQDYITSIAG